MEIPLVWTNYCLYFELGGRYRKSYINRNSFTIVRLKDYDYPAQGNCRSWIIFSNSWNPTYIFLVSALAQNYLKVNIEAVFTIYPFTYLKYLLGLYRNSTTCPFYTGCVKSACKDPSFTQSLVIFANQMWQLPKWPF